MNILCLNLIQGGVSKYRIVDPHVELQNQNKDWKITIGNEQHLDNVNFIKDVQIIFAHSTLSQKQEIVDKIIELKQKYGFKLIVDIDDYFYLDTKNPLYKFSIRKKEPQKIINFLKRADLCTTTTEIFAKEIQKYNKHVTVMPNSISLADNQFSTKENDSERVRIMWSGGSSHMQDLKEINTLFSYLYGKYNHTKIQSVLAGFNTKVKDVKTGKVVDSIKGNVWVEYEKIFTDNYNIKNNSYKKYLLEYNKRKWNQPLDNYEYRRIWTKGLRNYGEGYKHADICLAPLENNVFNKYKSQLKIIEAGFHKKPIIASNISPYQIDIINNKNGIIIDNYFKNWKKASLKLIESPAMREDLGNQLYNLVIEKYLLENTTKYRKIIYESII